MSCVSPSHLQSGVTCADVASAVASEEFIPLADVPSLSCMPRRHGHKRIDVRSVRRWATRGVGGVVLKAVLVGGLRCTTASWLAEFFARRGSCPHPSNPAPGLIPPQRHDSHERVVLHLEAEGV